VTLSPIDTYQDQVLGSFARDVLQQDSRLKKLEDNLNISKWEKHFNQKPFVVISGLIIIMFGGFWTVYTWQVDKHDKHINSEINKIKVEYESKIKWLKDKHLSDLTAQEKECKYDLKVAKNTENCVVKKSITKNSS